MVNALLRCVVSLMMAVAPCPAAFAQAYPAKAVRMIIPFPPGGPTDLMGRMAADRLGRAWNIQVIPDNRAGAGGNIGAELCAKSPPDGYTICMLTVAQTISPGIYRKLGFDPMKDFAHVTLMAILPSLLTAHPALPVKSVRDLVAMAKARPGQLAYASTGNGTSPHMLMEMLKFMAGVNLLHIPYKGQAPAVIDQISGQVQVAFNTAVTVMPHVKDGKLKPIAVSTMERFPPLPDLPSVDEAGIRGFDGSSWQGVVMPAGTPKEIVTRVYQELSGMLKAPETRDRLLAQGALASGITPDQFQDFIKRELDKWGRVAKAANVRVD